MDAQELFSAFMASGHGQQAVADLGQQGIGPDDAANMLGHAMNTAHDHVHDHAESAGILGEHPGRSFFAAFAAGLVKGDGIKGAFEDGAVGVLTAKITEVLCEKAGVDPGVASTVAAIATPYLVGFLKEHLGS